MPREKKHPMQRRHFEAIARTLLAVRPGAPTGSYARLSPEQSAVEQWERTVAAFTQLCASSSSNNLFRVDAFRRAAGLES